MMNHTSVLYLTTVLIWGSTFLAIRFQLGEVPGVVSIAYRFALAALMLLVWCRLTRKNMRFSPGQHLWMMAQGLMLFGFNYMLVYQAAASLTSGLIAVVFSTIIVMNIFNGALLFGRRPAASVVAGALFGLAGISLVFLPEITRLESDSATATAMVLSLGGTFVSSIGNMISARNQSRELPVVQTNAFGMAYGALALAVIAWFQDKPFVYEQSWSYTGSLVYLALFGSVVGFGSFLTLLGRIGAERAAYCMVLFPIVALGLSTAFEGYRWSPEALVGVLLVIVGNVLVITPKARLQSLLGRFLPPVGHRLE